MISFAIVQFAPGGPVERVIAQLQGNNTDPAARIGGGSGDLGGGRSAYRGSQGSTPNSSRASRSSSAYDKPAHERFFKMVWDYLRFDFGKSYFRDTTVLQLIKEKLPVSMSLGSGC